MRNKQRRQPRRWTLRRIADLGEWLAKHWLITLLGFVATVVGTIIAVNVEWRGWEERSKHPVLSIKPCSDRGKDGITYIRFKVHNDGTKEAVNFRWRILIPTDAPVAEGGTGREQGDLVVEGVNYTPFSLIHVATVYSKAPPPDVLVVPIKKDTPASAVKFTALWQIVSQDERASPAKYERIGVDLQTLARCP
jgi:hypothetical protein